MNRTARNPHALDRYTGGSSSGPASIVASGLCPAALGTDGGGSVRIPSSLCGIVGLKTTYGRTDMTGYMHLYLDYFVSFLFKFLPIESTLYTTSATRTQYILCLLCHRTVQQNIIL
jgi:Amidase